MIKSFQTERGWTPWHVPSIPSSERKFRVIKCQHTMHNQLFTQPMADMENTFTNRLHRSNSSLIYSFRSLFNGAQPTAVYLASSEMGRWLYTVNRGRSSHGIFQVFLASSTKKYSPDWNTYKRACLHLPRRSSELNPQASWTGWIFNAFNYFILCRPTQPIKASCVGFLSRAWYGNI